MIRASLTVRYQFEKDEVGNAREECWGEFEYLTLPRIGEMVDVWWDQGLQTVIVRNIWHRAIEVPVTHPQMSSWQKEPTIRIIADWHWAD